MPQKRNSNEQKEMVCIPTSHVVFILHLVLSIYPDGCHLAKCRALCCVVLFNCANIKRGSRKVGTTRVEFRTS